MKLLEKIFFDMLTQICMLWKPVPDGLSSLDKKDMPGGQQAPKGPPQTYRTFVTEGMGEL